MDQSPHVPQSPTHFGLSISWKLLAATAVVAAVMALIAIFGLTRIQTLNRKLTQTVDFLATNVKLCSLLKQDLITVTRAERNMMLARSEDGTRRFASVVDDVADDTHAHLVTRSLARARVSNEVHRARDGEEALAFLRREGEFADAPRPDVVLLDLQLPKLDGHEVLATIKQDHDLMRIPVVIMTTSDAERDREQAYELHANSYVVKPVDFERFRQLVEELSLYWGVWNEPPRE